MVNGCPQRRRRRPRLLLMSPAVYCRIQQQQRHPLETGGEGGGRRSACAVMRRTRTRIAAPFVVVLVSFLMILVGVAANPLQRLFMMKQQQQQHDKNIDTNKTSNNKEGDKNDNDNDNNKNEKDNVTTITPPQQDHVVEARAAAPTSTTTTTATNVTEATIGNETTEQQQLEQELEQEQPLQPLQPQHERNQQPEEEQRQLQQQQQQQRVLDATVYCTDLEQEKEDVTRQLDTMTMQWQQAQNDAQQWKDMKEHAIHEIAKIQSQADMELMQLRQELIKVQELLSTTRQELQTKQYEWEQHSNLTQEIAVQRIQETETLWKNEMDIISTRAQLDIQNAKRLAQQQAHEQCQEQIIIQQQQQQQQTLFLTHDQQQPQEQLNDLVFDPQQQLLPFNSSHGNTTTNNNSSSSDKLPHSSSSLQSSSMTLTTTAMAVPQQHYATLLIVERVKVQLLEEETKTLEAQLLEQKTIMEQLVKQVEEKYKMKLVEEERTLQQEWEIKLQEFTEQDACQLTVNKITKKYDTQLTKTMQVCDDVLIKLEYEKTVNSRQEQRNSDLEQVIYQLQNNITNLVQQQQRAKEQNQQAVQLLKNQHANATALLQQQHVDMNTNLTKQHNTTIHKLWQQHNNTIDRLLEEHNTTVRKLQNDILTLQSDMDKAQKKHELELEQTKVHVHSVWTSRFNVTTTELHDQMEQLQHRYDDMELLLQQERKQTKQDLSQRNKTINQYEIDLKNMTQQWQISQQNAEYWERTFMRRSYFNWTQVQGDATFWINERYEEVSILCQQHVIQPIYQQVHQFYYEKTHLHVWYIQYLKQYMDPIQNQAMIYYQKYIPRLIKLYQDQVHIMTATIRSQGRTVFQKAVTVWDRTICSSSSSLSRKNKLWVWVQEQLCDEPGEIVVWRVFTKVGFMSLIVFRHFLWTFIVQLIVWTLWLLKTCIITCLRILWYISPLRFLIRLVVVVVVQKRHYATTTTTGTTAPPPKTKTTKTKLVPTKKQQTTTTTVDATTTTAIATATNTKLDTPTNGTNGTTKDMSTSTNGKKTIKQ